MRIDVRNGHFTAAAPLRDYASLRSHSLLGALDRDLDTLVVCLSPQALPGGQAGLRCRVVGRRRDAGTVLGEHLHEDAYGAIDGALQALARELSPRRPRGRAAA